MDTTKYLSKGRIQNAPEAWPGEWCGGLHHSLRMLLHSA